MLNKPEEEEQFNKTQNKTNKVQNKNFMHKYNEGLIKSYKSSKNNSQNDNLDSKNDFLKDPITGQVQASSEQINAFPNHFFPNNIPEKSNFGNLPDQKDGSMVNNPGNNQHKVWEQFNHIMKSQHMNFYSSFVVSSYVHFIINFYYESYMERNKFYAKELGFVPYTLRFTNHIHQIRKKFLFANREVEQDTWFNLYHKATKSESESSKDVKNLVIKQVKHSKDRLFNKYNCRRHRAIFTILKIKEKSLEEGSFTPETKKEEEILNKKSVSSKPVLKKPDTNVKISDNNPDDHLFGEFLLQTGRPIGEIIDNESKGETGWEYSAAAFKYYHLQPLLFTKTKSGSESNSNQVRPNSYFSPDNVVNYNYYEYSLGKRSEMYQKKPDDSKSSSIKPSKRYKKKKSKYESKH